MKRKKRKSEKKSGKKLVEKAGLAMKHEFYLEASLIISYLMERKLKKVRQKIEKQTINPGFTLDQSIRRVKFLLLSSNQTELTERFSVVFIDEIRNWKNQRNEVFRDITERNVSHARMERLATEGVKLYKTLNNAAKLAKPTIGLSEGEAGG